MISWFCPVNKPFDESGCAGSYWAGPRLGSSRPRDDERKEDPNGGLRDMEVVVDIIGITVRQPGQCIIMESTRNRTMSPGRSACKLAQVVREDCRAWGRYFIRRLRSAGREVITHCNPRQRKRDFFIPSTSIARAIDNTVFEMHRRARSIGGRWSRQRIVSLDLFTTRASVEESRLCHARTVRW